MSIRPLPTELADIARLELNEDPGRVEDDLQHIKDWLAKQPHLRARTVDQWLIAFLRGCKYSLERTKEKLDLYYSIRNTAPDLFKIKHTDPLFNEILDQGAFVILPKLATPTSPRVIIIRPGSYNAEKYSITDVLCVTYILEQAVSEVGPLLSEVKCSIGKLGNAECTERERYNQLFFVAVFTTFILCIWLLEDDNAVVAGVRFILDLDAVTMAHFLQMTPMTMKKMVVGSQDAKPTRLKGTHYLNTPTGFETVFNAIKSLLSEKNKSRLYVHNKDYDEMYKTIPKEILPTEYGGNGGDIKDIIELWKKKVEQYSDYLKEDWQFGTDESKRPGKPKTAEDMFGLEGSFRQLNFD